MCSSARERHALMGDTSPLCSGPPWRKEEGEESTKSAPWGDGTASPWKSRPTAWVTFLGCVSVLSPNTNVRVCSLDPSQHLLFLLNSVSLPYLLIKNVMIHITSSSQLGMTCSEGFGWVYSISGFQGFFLLFPGSRWNVAVFCLKLGQELDEWTEKVSLI